MDNKKLYSRTFLHSVKFRLHVTPNVSLKKSPLFYVTSTFKLVAKTIFRDFIPKAKGLLEITLSLKQTREGEYEST